MLKYKKMILQVLRFGIVGGLAFLIDYSLLLVLTECLGVFYLVSAAISFSISTIFNYIFSMLWVFNGKNNVKNPKHIMIFVVLSIVGLGINQITMFYLVEVIQIYYGFSKLVATFIVMLWNYSTRKIFLDEHK